MSYHTAFLWFWGQNLGPQNADLFTNLSQSHSLLEKIRAVASKIAVAFLPFSSFPETEPRASVHSTQAKPHPPDLWILLINTILH